MYRIIGVDGKEYGPIPAAQLRQWIAEGRVNGLTQVLQEGTTEWKTLSQVPEFAADLAAGAPAATPQPQPQAPGQFPGATTAAADLVNGPAIGLIVVAILGFCGQVAGLVARTALTGMAYRQNEQQLPWGNMFSGALGIVGAIIGILTSGVILFGGLKMKKLENYSLAMAASVIAMIPCISPCCLIGLPIGIWALVVLNKPEVKSAFH